MRLRYVLTALLAFGLPMPCVLRAQDSVTTAASPATAGSGEDDSGLPSEPGAAKNAATMTGTVTDAYGNIVPGATVAVERGNAAGRETKVANDNAYFAFNDLKPGIPYRVTVSAAGFDPWIAPSLVLAPGQFFELTGIKLKLENAVTSVTVIADQTQIATQQVQIEEKQRVLGIVPNFYVVYDSKDAVPLTAKLKFQMAFKTAVDPVTIFGAAFLAGMNQAGNTPNFQQGWAGYGQRFGAAYTDGVTDVMFGGAILPTLLHQDPRYYYQGTGTTMSRLRHAMLYPFVCKGDNGKWQSNYSTMGGDLISSSLSNAYYPQSNRGVAFTFEGFAEGTGTREISSILQEFVLRRLTTNSKGEK